MNLSFSDLLLSISNALLIPNILLLLFLFAFSVLQLGGFLAEFWERYHFSPYFHNLIQKQIKNDNLRINLEAVNEKINLMQMDMPKYLERNFRPMMEQMMPILEKMIKKGKDD